MPRRRRTRPRRRVCSELCCGSDQASSVAPSTRVLRALASSTNDVSLKKVNREIQLYAQHRLYTCSARVGRTWREHQRCHGEQSSTRNGLRTFHLEDRMQDTYICDHDTCNGTEEDGVAIHEAQKACRAREDLPRRKRPATNDCTNDLTAPTQVRLNTVWKQTE